jgi:hypothetical protein
MDMNAQRAVNPSWKISTIPKDAGNASEPVVANNAELEAVIANPGSLLTADPVEARQDIARPSPRYNANVPYSPQPVIYSMQDQELMVSVRRAVANGWQGYTRFANDSVTIGLEAEAVVIGMKKQQMSVSKLLEDKDFIKALSYD